MTRAIHWFRKDLRLQDNTALREVAVHADEWLPIFIIDPRISDDLHTAGRRHRFLLECLESLHADLAKRNIPLLIRSGRPESILPKLMHETGARLLTFNRDVTPFSRRRDSIVEQAVRRTGAEVIARQDHVVYASSEIRTATDTAYSVYTPYRRRWMKRWEDEPRPPQRCGKLKPAIPGFVGDPVPTLGPRDTKIRDLDLPAGGEAAARRRLRNFLSTSIARYDSDRDRPDIEGTSRLSPYLKLGAISARECVVRAMEAAACDASIGNGVAKWLNELVWREFYSGILEEHPRVLKESYRMEFDSIPWNNDPSSFEAWCKGETGYPIVDAGMRQLQATGWMHNRVRMIVASFLTKDLLVDWRKGEQFFFENLVDGDRASNNGGWQWAASTGTDAQPYFRIFNPTAQGKRWDPEGRYVRRWVPELESVPSSRIHSPWDGNPPRSYPSPIVDHATRRKEAIELFSAARSHGVSP